MARESSRELGVKVLAGQKRLATLASGRVGFPTRPGYSRVIQFWDKDHLVAKQLDEQISNSQPSCCRHEGVLWDLVAVYPRGVQWGGSQPVFVDGQVAKVNEALARRLAEVSHQ